MHAKMLVQAHVDAWPRCKLKVMWRGHADVAPSVAGMDARIVALGVGFVLLIAVVVIAVKVVKRLLR